MSIWKLRVALRNAKLPAGFQAFRFLVQMFHYHARQRLGNPETDEPTFKT